MKILSIQFILLLIVIDLSSQQISLTSEKIEQYPTVSQKLVRIHDFARVNDRLSVQKKITEMGLVMRNDGKINVELINRNGNENPEIIARQIGLEVHSSWQNRSDCYMEPDQVAVLMDRLHEGYFLSPVIEEPLNNEGPGLQNTQSYIDAGRDGNGIKIGILDSGFDSLLSAITLGHVPSNIDTVDYTGDNMDTGGGNPHGTACAEVAFDNAPGASFYLYHINSGNGTHWGNAISHAIANNVDILSISLGPHNTGWDDNSGPQCQSVINATNNGMLVFVSAGNEAQKHWQGVFKSTDQDMVHEWNKENESFDETNDYVLQPQGASFNRDQIRAWMQWDSPETSDHYDLFLYDSTGTVILTSSEETNDFEYLTYTNPNNFSITVKIVVRAVTENSPEFELFVHPNSLQHKVSESSIECPANTTVPNCISVGQVGLNDYTDSIGSTPIATSSSHGPTNNGNQAPDICAVGGSTTFGYNGSFFGTSCSAPNAAGAAAALWSAHPYYSADAIRLILLRKAILFKDWGDTGTDYIYGAGGLYLKDYTSNTRYIHPGSGNTTGTSSLPYTSIQQADQFMPIGYRAFFLGHTFQEPPAGTIIDKPMIYRSVQKSTIIR